MSFIDSMKWNHKTPVDSLERKIIDAPLNPHEDDHAELSAFIQQSGMDEDAVAGKYAEICAAVERTGAGNAGFSAQNFRVNDAALAIDALTTRTPVSTHETVVDRSYRAWFDGFYGRDAFTERILHRVHSDYYGDVAGESAG